MGTTDHLVDPRTDEPPCPDCETDLYVKGDRGAYDYRCGYCQRRWRDGDV